MQQENTVVETTEIKERKLGVVIFSIIAKVLFGLQVIGLIGGTVYIALTKLISMTYIYIIIAAIVVICGLQGWMLFTKKRPVLKGVISIIVSIALLLSYGYGVWMVGVFHNSLSNLPDENPEVPPVVVEVREQPFIIFLSGMDNTAGANQIVEKGLSDVNMILAVDPEEHKILMVSLPRDCYLPLNGDETKMDKLTHAGTYGIKCSMDTIGAALDVQFNYYIKVNFKSVHDIVNAVDGITVNSEIAFTSNHSYTKTEYTFKKGINHLNGDQALAFVRERKSIKGGDLQRNKHQQMVISAIIDKAISPAILNPNKLSQVLDSVTKNTKTNISQEEIQKLVLLQQEEMPKWDISSLSVTGTGAYRPCYAMGGQELSVVLADEASLNQAITALQQFKAGK